MMEQFLDRCRRRIGMAVTPVISPEVFELVRRHLEVSMPTFLLEDYLLASQFILQILCPPANADTSPNLQEALRSITGELCSLENASQHEKAVIAESLRYVFEALSTSSATDAPPMGPEEEDCPDKYGLYLFHLFSIRSGIPHAYRTFVIPCLHAIYYQIELETRSSSPLRSSRGRSLAYDYSLSLRYFLRYANVPPLHTSQFTGRPSVSEIDAAFQLCVRASAGKLDTKTVELHKQRVLVAFGYETQTILGPRPGWSRSEATEHGQAKYYFRSQIIPPGEDPWDDPDHSVAREIHYAMPRDAFDERECPDEYATSSIAIPPELEGNTIAASIYKRMQAAATAIAQSKRHWWDRATLPLYAYLHLLVNGNPLDPEFALAWLIGQTGQDPARLADLRFINGTCPEYGLGLHFDSRSLLYRRPDDWIGWKKNKHCHLLQDCLRSTDRVALRLPPEVWSPLVPYFDRRRTIQNKLPEELRSLVFLSLEPPYSAISVEALDKYLRTLSNSSFPFQITASSLARSFWHLNGGRFGAEDLTLPYVAGRVPRALRSQLFYARMTMDRINHDYEQYENGFLQALLAEAKVLDAGSDSPTLTQTLMRLFPFLCDNSTAVATPPLLIANEAVGSEAVPRRDKIQAFLSVATEILDNLSCEDDPRAQRRYFNLFMILTRFQYSLGTGLRPVGDSRLSLNNVMIKGESSYAMLGEKANGRFADTGLIKHSPTVHRLCMSAMESGSAILSLLRPTSPSILDDYAAMGQPIFFLIDDQGQLALMLPSLVRAELSALGLSDVLIAPLNAPRHYLLTYLFDQRVARPLCDKIARHQHEGYEWFSLLSGTDTDKADEILCGVIETMLDDLGVRPMQFKRRRHHA